MLIISLAAGDKVQYLIQITASRAFTVKTRQGERKQ